MMVLPIFVMMKTTEKGEIEKEEVSYTDNKRNTF